MVYYATIVESEVLFYIFLYCLGVILMRASKKTFKDKYPLLFDYKNDNSDIELIYNKAWKEAKKAAGILKKEYGAKEVWLFGSLVDQIRFNKRSDIDLAEIGIPDNQFYSAVAGITRAVKDFKVDLVDIKDCRDVLKKAVEKEGIKI